MISPLRGFFLLVFGILAAVAIPGVLIVSGRINADHAKRLRAEGKRTPTTSTQVTQRIRKADRVTYTFVAGGRTVERTESTSRAVSDRALAGAVDVTYLPSDPNVATLDLERLESTASQNLSWMPLLFVGVGLSMAYRGAKALR